MDVNKTIRTALEETLDKMAFMYFEEPEDEEVLLDQFDFITRISFKGVINGRLHLFFKRNSAEVIARNLVGIRDNDELFDGTLEDAICEFTNIVMGRTMTSLDPANRFDMEVPIIVKSFEPDPTTSNEVEFIGLLDESPFRLFLNY